MRRQNRYLFGGIAAADAAHHRGGLFIGAEAAHQGGEFIAAMGAFDGGNAMAPLARYTMASLAAANEQGRICRLRESRGMNHPA